MSAPPDEGRKTGVPASGYAITMHQDQATFMRQLAEATSGSRQKAIALICAVGYRSAVVQGRLNQAGFENVVDVAEGMIGGRRGIGWINSGLPLRAGPQASRGLTGEPIDGGSRHHRKRAWTYWRYISCWHSASAGATGVSGRFRHRDHVLSKKERERKIVLCCSRARYPGGEIVIDL